MIEDVLWTLGIAYLMRGAFTAGVIKSWLMWEGRPVDPVTLALTCIGWPFTILMGWVKRRGK